MKKYESEKERLEREVKSIDEKLPVLEKEIKDLESLIRMSDTKKHYTEWLALYNKIDRFKEIRLYKIQTIKRLEEKQKKGEK